ncbi:MAG: hypothetical protein QXP98_03955 [Thermoproteus sp.]
MKIIVIRRVSLINTAATLLIAAAKLPARILAVVVALAAIPAFLFYFAGWNVQSIQYSEYYPQTFLAAHGPSVGPYSRLPTAPNFLINNNINPGMYYKITHVNNLIQIYYYTQSYIINKINTYLLPHESLIYNSGAFKLVKPVR